MRELLAAAQQERKAKLDAGRVETVFKVGGRRRVLLRTKERLDSAERERERERERARERETERQTDRQSDSEEREGVKRER